MSSLDYLRFALCDATDPSAAAAHIEQQFNGITPQAILFFAGVHLEAIATAIHKRFPDARSIGCSTAGEIGQGVFTTNSLSAVAIASPAEAAVYRVPNLTEFRFEQGTTIIDSLCADLGIAMNELIRKPEEFVFLILADGLSGMEEVLLASLMVHVPNVKLVGGSAGDNFAFVETKVACCGEVDSHGASIMLLKPGVEFHTFAGHSFEPTERTIVVTGADPEKRLIHRIDGKSANLFAAEYYGMTTKELAADESSPAQRNPLVFGVRSGKADSYFNRSLMRIVGTSLLMAGATEEGAILTLMKPTDLVKHGKKGRKILGELCRNPIGQVLFDCGGRLSQAQTDGDTEALAREVAFLPTAGFTTYGEFFGPLLVNHTLTGVVFDGPNE